MRMPELKSLARDRGLRNYSQMRKAELVALLQNNPPPSRSGALGFQLQLHQLKLGNPRVYRYVYFYGPMFV